MDDNNEKEKDCNQMEIYEKGLNFLMTSVISVTVLGVILIISNKIFPDFFIDKWVYHLSIFITNNSWQFLVLLSIIILSQPLMCKLFEGDFTLSGFGMSITSVANNITATNDKIQSEEPDELFIKQFEELRYQSDYDNQGITYFGIDYQLDIDNGIAENWKLFLKRLQEVRKLDLRIYVDNDRGKGILSSNDLVTAGMHKNALTNTGYYIKYFHKEYYELYRELQSNKNELLSVERKMEIKGKEMSNQTYISTFLESLDSFSRITLNDVKLNNRIIRR